MRHTVLSACLAPHRPVPHWSSHRARAALDWASRQLLLDRPKMAAGDYATRTFARDLHASCCMLAAAATANLGLIQQCQVLQIASALRTRLRHGHVIPLVFLAGFLLAGFQTCPGCRRLDAQWRHPRALAAS